MGGLSGTTGQSGPSAPAREGSRANSEEGKPNPKGEWLDIGQER